MLWWALLLPLLVAASPLRTQVQADFRLTPTAVTSRLSIFCTVLNQTIQVVVQCNTVEVIANAFNPSAVNISTFAAPANSATRPSFFHRRQSPSEKKKSVTWYRPASRLSTNRR